MKRFFFGSLSLSLSPLVLCNFYISVLCHSTVQEFQTTNNEEAAVLAASRAASTVIDAANSIEALR